MSGSRTMLRMDLLGPWTFVPGASQWEQSTQLMLLSIFYCQYLIVGSLPLTIDH